MQVLDEATWRAREAAHQARVEALTAGHRERRAAGVAHPVHDFLFTYYSHRPAQLRRWHPGFGIRLENGPQEADHPGYRDGALAQEWVVARRPLIERLHALLAATAGRAPTLGCFGLHEWAMVHGTEETRHDRPLRLGRAGTDRVVASHRIACSHFDAFRFFTDAARPLNTLRPGSEDRAAFEQPGCLHANMDLYKHAFRLSPMIWSELVVDAFELAWDIRVLDMRAAPYDLAGLTHDDGTVWTPVRIETPDGKREYAAAQAGFAERAAPIRERLAAACGELLAVG